MDKAVIRVEGLREVRKQLSVLDDAVGKEMLARAHKNIAARVVAMALPNVPVRSGRLKASVRGLGSLAAATGKAGGVRVPYAAAVHWGTGPRPGAPGPHNITRRPFLFDAVQKLRRSGAVDEYARQLERVINRSMR